MKKRFAPHRFLSFSLAAILLLQPLLHATNTNQLTGGRAESGFSVVHAKELEQGGTNVYLPVVADDSNPPASTATPTPTGSPTATPTATTPADTPISFEISSPIDGQSISGYILFAIQSTAPQVITNVTFKAGEQELGTDNNSSDGFQIFVNTDDLPPGTTQFSATVSSAAGSTTESVTAQIVSNPPTSATVDEAGSVLASEIGSVISILPDSVPEGTTITVDELTQEETTERHGIDWETMGVTFLGAQEVQSSVPLSRPFGMVASAGFGNRVQPGQAVVNYLIAPDADGDGADEIIVVNTASVAPNGDVLADPVPPIQMETVQVVTAPAAQNGNALSVASTASVLQQTISGPPGTIIDIRGSGFNESSPVGNVGIFRSTVDGTEVVSIGLAYADPEDSSYQIFSVAIPNLPAGAATLTILNKSTDRSSDPIELTVEVSPPLTRPANDIIDEFFGETISLLESLPSPDPVEDSETGALLAQLAEVRTAFQELGQDTSAEVTQQLENVASQIVNSNALELIADARTEELGRSSPFTVYSDLSGAGCLTPKERKILKYIFLINGTVSAAICALSFTGAAAVICGALVGIYYGALAIEEGDLPSCKKPPACPPSQTSPNGPTGMGSAPPPGGPGCGGTGGGGGNNLVQSAAQRQQSSPIMIKIFSNGNAIPFTGRTDPGGYFFIPFIPADESFTAMAIDTATGNTRTFIGTGPRLDSSVLMFFDFFKEQEQIFTIRWDGGGDGTSWHDPLNWDMDTVPGSDDLVSIDVAEDVTVVHSEGNTSIVSLTSAENLTLSGGSLTVRAASTINGAFSMEPDTSLTADGIAVTFTAAGTTTLTSANINALNGATINLDKATTYNGNASNQQPRLRAVGPRSVIDLSGVTNLIGNTRTGFFSVDYLHIEAENGGRIDLSNVGNLSQGRINAVAIGANSVVDLSMLATTGDRSVFDSQDGGDLMIDSVTSLNNTTLKIAGDGTVPVSQITEIQSGSVVLDNVSLTLPNITNVDGAIFTVENGGTLSLPGITSYTGAEGASNSDWIVRGAGSLLDLSNITSLTGNTFASTSLKIEVSEGAKVDLSKLVQVLGGGVNVTVENSQSLVDFSALTNFTRGSRTRSSLKPINGGTILIPFLTTLNGVDLYLDGTGIMATEQITSLTSGRVDVIGVTPTLDALTTVNGTSFFASGGGKVMLPNITSYEGDGLDSFTALNAEGTNSLIDLSAVTSLQGNTFVNDALKIQAVAGGKIDLSQVVLIDTGMVQVSADGSNSVIDLSSLTGLARGGRGRSFLAVQDNGLIELNGNTLAVDRGEISVGETGTMAVGAVTLDSESLLKGTGTLPDAVTNNGATEPGDSAGGLTISGTFTQTGSGKTVIEIGGATPKIGYDQVTVSGGVALTGTLEIELINSYEPAIGDSFEILIGSSIMGAFGTVNGLSIGNGKQFEVKYEADKVVLEVVAE